MPLVYSATFPPTSVTAQVDLFQIEVPSGRTLEALSVHVGQNTDAGDAESEMLSYHIKKLNGGTPGTGGQTCSLSATSSGASLVGITVTALNTAKATGGTIGTIQRDAFHIAAGLHYVPVPEERHEVNGGDLFIVELDKTPSDGLGMVGTLNFSLTGG